MTAIPPRPTLLDALVKASSAPLSKWYVAHGGNGQVAQSTFNAALRDLYASVPHDAYQLAKAADLGLKWTAANLELVTLFADAIAAAPKAHFDMETEWVTMNGVRVSQAPRDPVLFYVGDELCHGIVQNVLPARAQLVVALVDSLDDRTRVTQMHKLNAEQIIERPTLPSPDLSEPHAAV